MREHMKTLFILCITLALTSCSTVNNADSSDDPILDADGKQLQVSIENFIVTADSAQLDYTIESTYNANNQLISNHYYRHKNSVDTLSADTLFRINEYTYNDTGEEYVHNVHVYNSDGTKRINYYDIKNELFAYEIMEYNDFGSTTKKSTFTSSDSLTAYIVYTYKEPIQ